MISLHPYDDLSAFAVFSDLDPHDRIEACAMRGQNVTHLGLFADWRAMRGVRLLDLTLRDETSQQTFAVLALGHTGQAGVAQAALLARDHTRFRRPLVTAARRICNELPGFCADNDIRRIEARCLATHPTASRFLTVCGFAPETDMPGFGGDGAATFRQFAWIKERRKQ